MPTTALIVDDHSSFRRFARKLLEAAGFDVVGDAEDGTTAVEADGNGKVRLRDNVLPPDVAEALGRL